MADGVFNIAKGHVNEYQDRVDGNDPAASVLTVVLLKAAEADATLQDYEDLSTLLGQAGNTEADFTNYTRKTITDTDLTASVVDQINDRKESDITADQTWTAAGGTLDNTLVKLLVCYDPLGTDVDANMIPLTHHDFAATTNGGDLTAQFDAAGYFRAS